MQAYDERESEYTSPERAFLIRHVSEDMPSKIKLFVSSPEFVGDYRFGQLPKGMI